LFFFALKNKRISQSNDTETPITGKFTKSKLKLFLAIESFRVVVKTIKKLRLIKVFNHGVSQSYIQSITEFLMVIVIFKSKIENHHSLSSNS
jgi:hypothetical protein